MRTWLIAHDRWIPGIFVAGFGVVLVANLTMAWIALGTFSGLATADYYDRGRTYNATLATADALAATGWTAHLTALPDGDGRYTVEVRLTASDGAPLDGATVAVRFVRPADAAADFDLALNAVGGGLWRADMAAPAAGLWQARLVAARDGEVFAVEQRLVLGP